MRYRSVATWFSIAVLFSSLPLAFSKDMVVDFGYRPQQWRTLICPPDDAYKTLVTEKGALVYHFGRTDSRFRHVGSRGRRRRREDRRLRKWSRRGCPSCRRNSKRAS